MPLSIAIITRNEEHNLPRLLESLRGLAAEIVVLDSGSTDRTLEIARAAGARVESAGWPGYIEQKNRALDLCTQPWILCLDADEALSPELAQGVRKFFEKDPAADVTGAWVNRRTWYLGAWIWHAWYPEWRLRLVRKGSARWGGTNPHDTLQMAGGQTLRLEGDLLHYSYKDLSDHFQRSVRYAKIAAEAMGEKKFAWRKLLFSPGVAFVRHWLFKSGWRDGWRGWLIATVSMIGCFAKYAFLLEARMRNKDGRRMEKEGRRPAP